METSLIDTLCKTKIFAGKLPRVLQNTTGYGRMHTKVIDIRKEKMTEFTNVNNAPVTSGLRPLAASQMQVLLEWLLKVNGGCRKSQGRSAIL